MVDFSTSGYWDERFTHDQKSFEWLRDPRELLPHIHRISGEVAPEDHRILHIGPGTSKFSLYLRDLVQSPAQIHNVDFSLVGVTAGKKLESDAINDADKTSAGLPASLFMEWSCVDLMNVIDIRTLQAGTMTAGAYTLIIDKSTSDAIACGQVVATDPSAFYIDMGNPAMDESPAPSLEYQVYPVWLLTLHLAAVTGPGALWVILSYKEERFDFLERPSLVQSLDLNGRDIPVDLRPTTYWTMQSKQYLTDEEYASESSTQHPVYRPIEGKWLFILKRTGKTLELRE